MTSTILPRFCVFCGNKPTDKNREHIIPQWLIKLTGDPNREINLGVNTKLLREEKKFDIRKFSFTSFTVPACSKCNEEYSKLESETQEIIKKILSRDFLNSNELNILLDWFDKVRIGLWLSTLLMDREIAPVDPQFHIKKRIGEKDRCLLVYEMNDNWEGIQFIGINAPAFSFSPSCFALCINNCYFFNVSYDYLFSKNIGFPYPAKQEYHPVDKRVHSEINPGLNKFKLPLLNSNLINSSIELYQPMIFNNLGEYIKDDENSTSLYDNEYVKENCINFENGTGKIFYKDGNNLISLNDETELLLNDGGLKYKREKLMNLMADQVLKTQLNLMSKIPSVKNLEIDERKKITQTHRSIIHMQKKFHQTFKNSK